MKVNDEFERKLREPVDIEKCRDALQRFIDKRFVLRVPVHPDDDDMLISRALDELEKYRKGELHA